jgi:hypothetical protein
MQNPFRVEEWVPVYPGLRGFELPGHTETFFLYANAVGVKNNFTIEAE